MTKMATTTILAAKKKKTTALPTTGTLATTIRTLEQQQ